MIKPIRRVVTGHNAQGRSVIASDGPSPHVLTLPGRPDFALTDLVGRTTIMLRPLLLVGDPGGGKSRFARRLGEVLGLSVWRALWTAAGKVRTKRATARGPSRA